MDESLRHMMVMTARQDANETISEEQTAFWLDTNTANDTHIPKASRPEGGYFYSTLAVWGEPENENECWNLYREEFRVSMVHEITHLQKEN